MTSVDVVIVSYNRRDLLPGCLDALAASSQPTNVVVVDNASADASAQFVENTYPQVDLLANSTNLGFAAAVNRGAARGAAPFILLLNPDARISTDAIGALVDVMTKDDGVGAAGPRINDEQGHLELTSGRTMSLANDAWFKCVMRLGGANAPLIGSAIRRRYAADHDSESLTAACLMVRRDAFDTVDGLDDTFFLYAEDVDFCRRLRDEGWRLRYLAGVTVQHARGASGVTAAADTDLVYRASQVAFYAKHRGALSRGLLRAYMEIKSGVGALLGDARAKAVWRWLRAGQPRVKVG